MKYKQSKIAYLIILFLIMGIATYDLFRPREEQVQIVLKNRPQALLPDEMVAKLN